jgi:Rps23 Pro-64 3,4-dihydroxylase Tpa1-like proline 4-hydroxylase
MDFSGIKNFNKPYPHFAGLNILQNGGESMVFNWLNAEDTWELTEESFYTQYEFSLLDTKLPENLGWLKDSSTIAKIVALFSLQFGNAAIELVGITVHKLTDGHKIGIHNDFIGNDETHRFLIQINSAWADADGGYLMLFNSANPQDVAKIVRPVNNSGFGFEISGHSYHAVSTVRNYSRFTIVYTFKAI